MLYDHRTRAFGTVRVWTGQDGEIYRDTHKGDDFAETYGNDPVPAIQPGRVIARGHSTTFGYYLWVRRDSRIVVKYHMFNRLPTALLNSLVTVGQILGFTGASAANASGNHSHVQVEDGAIPVNPQPFIRQYIGTLSGGSGTPFNNSTPTPAPQPVIRLDEKMIRIEAPNRGIALIAAGYYRHLNGDEEVQQSAPLVDKHVSGNDRQFDLWVSMALGGQAANQGRIDTAVVDVAPLVSAIQTALSDANVQGVDAQAIATAIVDEQYNRLAE